MRVLVTGTEGYIGIVLASFLLKRGYDVLGLDTGFYRDAWLYNNGVSALPSVKNKDLRRMTADDVAGMDWTTKKIHMTSDGTPWRPLVHVLDICEAIACTLEAPREVVHNEVFNVGRTSENYQVREIAAIVAEVFPGCDLVFGTNDSDNRSYRVSFDKIATHLPGFQCRRDVALGARELHAVFERIGMSRA